MNCLSLQNCYSFTDNSKKYEEYVKLFEIAIEK